MSPGLDFIERLVWEIEKRVKDDYTSRQGVDGAVQHCLDHLVKKLADMAVEEE